MSATVIVSYDGTPNDDDALALGGLLAQAGARLALAYVRHAREDDPSRERRAQQDAERRLEQGVELLGDPAVPRHVVLSASTGEGLAELAVREHAQIVVFGSDYRTSPGRVEPGATAQRLLEGGGVAVAVAPAGLRGDPGFGISSIAVLDGEGDPAVRRSAGLLAARLGASLGTDGDLLVVGSKPSAPPGRIALGGSTRTELDRARTPVLVLPRGRALEI